MITRTPTRAVALGTPIGAALAVLALAFALAHIPYLPSTLEDIDSVNFALGVRDFDVAQHRPHPPGYPIYIALGKVGVAMARVLNPAELPSTIEARTLAWLSLLGATVAIALLYRILSCVSRGEVDGSTPPWREFDQRALAATALTITCPLFWYTAARPMSDVPGLAAAFAAQACLALAWWRQQPDASGDRRLAPELIGASGRMIVLGSLLAAVSIGFRSQNAVLTVPLLLAVLIDRIGRGVAGALIGGGVAFAVGIALWAIPLIIASGGLDAYLAALGSQAGEDFAGVEMLYLNPTNTRLAAFALLRTFIYPWDSIVLGSVIIILAAIGAGVLLVRDQRAFWIVAVLSVPYLVFHLLFQDTTYTRYALPLVPSVAFLAVRGVELIAFRAAVPVTSVLTLWAMVTAMPVLAAYGSQPSPAVRAVRDMNQSTTQGPSPTLAMHQTFRRPLEAEALTIEAVLPSPPRREWLELARYWRDGNTGELWFLADPRRSDLALIDPRSRQNRWPYLWNFESLSQLGGMRPSGLTWYRISPPGWFAEEGWALTPETAGVARLMGRGPHLDGIAGWVRRRPDAVRMMIGGRHLGSTNDVPVHFSVMLDGREVAQWDAPAGFFLNDFDLPAGALSGDGPLARLTLRSTTKGGSQVIPAAIEQFDLQTRGTLMWGYDAGWHEAEYDPQLGMWRWTSERATLRIIDATSPVRVMIRVEAPSRYFDDRPTVQMMAGDRVIGETNFDAGNFWNVYVPLEALQSTNGRLTIRTDRTFVPAQSGSVADQRRLGLRVFDIEITAQP